MSTHILKLTINIESDWHVGSGQQGGAYADSLTLKSPNHLPYLPGKSLKGLMRSTLQLANHNGWLSNDDFTLLFGSEGESQFSQGILQVSNAELSHPEQVYLAETAGAAKCLYRVLQFTAIDHTTQTAKETSLRSMEVAIPMILEAEVTLDTTHPLVTSAQCLPLLEVVAQSVKLITNVGAKQYRGLGKANVTAHIETVEESM